MRYSIDPSVRVRPRRVIGGSPPSVLRLSAVGDATVRRISEGEDVDSTPLVSRLTQLNCIHPVAPLATTRSPHSVTIVTPTFGPPRHVLNDCYNRVLIVDDHSDPPVTTAQLRTEHNLGPGGARNRGLQEVDTEFVAFIDSDVDCSDAPNWIEALLFHFDDPSVAAVAPRITSRSGSSALANYEHRFGALDMGTQPGVVRPGSRITYVPAAAVICRTSAIRACGGFDESLRTGEDVDLVWRLVDEGHTVRYDPSVTLTHEPRRSWHAWFAQRVGYGASSAPLAQRHPHIRVTPLSASSWSLAALTTAIAIRSRHRSLVLTTLIIHAASRKLRHDIPSLTPRESHEFVTRGTYRTGVALTRAVRRVWWPALLVAAPISRAARRLLIISFLTIRHPFTIADDIGHGLGIWKRVIAERCVAPVVPTVTTTRPRLRRTST